jgi:hypothetical protein
MRKSILFVIIITTLFSTYIAHAQSLIVSTVSPNNVTQSTIVLNGMYANNGANDTVTVWFEYGLSPSALSSTTIQIMTSAMAYFSDTLTGLYCDSTYYVRAVVKHSSDFFYYGTVLVFTTIPCTVTAVEKLDITPKITIAPNPVQNISRITVSPLIQSGEIQIYNMIGNLVKTMPIIDGVSEIHKEDFSSGMYIYQTVIKGKAYTGKISVQ